MLDTWAVFSIMTFVTLGCVHPFQCMLPLVFLGGFDQYAPRANHAVDTASIVCQKA